MSASSIESQLKVLRQGAAELIDEAELRRKLEKGRPLRVKAGFDPTAADLHLGHTVVMRKLRQFQDHGHEVLFLIGDFTARIGDPTGRSETRPVLSAGQIQANAETYQDQAFKILDRARTRVVRNSTWFDEMSAAKLIEVAGKYTVARMLERDDFQSRYRGGQPISVHEFLYPLIQGYDSYELSADVELGGTDQKFNLLVGREVQRSYGQEPQVVMTMPLLEGLDGVQKMSKSLGNAVGVSEGPSEIYGKIMSISDELMIRFYELLSMNAERAIGDIRSGAAHPMDAKKRLAAEIVERYHGREASEHAAEEFRRRFQAGGLPDEIPEFTWNEPGAVGVCKLLFASGLTSSMSDARRLVAQGGVRLDGERVTDPNLEVSGPADVLLQAGKRRLVRVCFGA